MAVDIACPLTSGMFPFEVPEERGVGAVQWVLAHSQESLIESPFPVAKGAPHPGLIACGRVKLIKNNCLAGVISVPWQSPITWPRLSALSLLLQIRNMPVPGDTFSCGKVRPEIRAFQIMRGRARTHISEHSACASSKPLAQFCGADTAALYFPSGESKAQRGNAPGRHTACQQYTLSGSLAGRVGHRAQGQV